MDPLKLRELAQLIELDNELSQQLDKVRARRRELQAELLEYLQPPATLPAEVLRNLQQLERDLGEEAFTAEPGHTTEPDQEPRSVVADHRPDHLVELEKEQQHEAKKSSKRRHQVDEDAAWDEQPTHATAVLALLQRLGGQASVARIADAMIKQRGTTLAAVKILLKTMERRGEIRRVERGVYGLIREAGK